MPDIAHLGMQVDVNSPERAVTVLGNLTAAAANTEQATKELGATSRETGVLVGTAVGVWNRAGTTLVDMKNKARDAAAGFIAMGEGARRSGREVYDWERIVVSAGDGANKASGGMRNFMLQMNQVGQVAMMTGQPLQALAVQLPDLLIGLPALPMALAMVGTMAAGTALNMWMAADSTKDYDDAIDDLNTALDDYKSYAATASASTISLREEFGANAEQVQQYARFMMQLKANDILSGISNMENGFSQGFGSAVEALQARRAAVESAALVARTNPGDSASATGAREAAAAVLTDARVAANEAAASLHMTTAEVARLDAALTGMKGARNLEELQRKADDAQKLLMDIFSKLPPGTDTGGLSSLFQVVYDLNTDLIRILPQAGAAATEAGRSIQEGFIGPMQASMPMLIEQLGVAYSEGNTQRVTDLTKAILGFSDTVGTAPARLAEMREQLEMVIELAEQDMGNEQLQAAALAAATMLEKVEEAEGAVTSLNEADMTGLENSFKGVVGFAETLLTSLGLIDGKLGDMGQGPLPGQFGGGGLPGTATPEAVIQGLMARGLPQHIAQGFAGNFKVESNFDTSNTTGDGGHAWGLAQWNDRRDDLLAFADAQGKAWDDLNVQLDFVMHELRGKERDAYLRIIQAQSAEEAAGLISTYYERPGTPHLAARRQAAAGYAAQGLGSGAGWVGNEFDGPLPPDRPMDLGVPELPNPTRPQARPFELAEAHTEAMEEEEAAAMRLIASFDPLIDRELKLADAKRQLDAAVAGGMDPAKAADILAKVEAGLDQDAADSLQAVEDGLNGLLSQMDEGADIAQKYAEAQKIVADAIEAEVITAARGAEILAQFHGHLLATSQGVTESLQDAEKLVEERKEAFKGAFEDIGAAMANVLVYGESWKEQFGNLLLEAAAKLTSSGFSSLLQTGFNSLFPALGLGPGSSSVLPGIVGALGGGGGGGFGVQIPAALSGLLDTYAGGGDTGYGPRSGGLDGQGGFLAMLHPQERVEDDYGGGGRRGGGSMTVSVIGARGNREIEQMVQQGISTAFANYNQRQPDRVQFINQNWRDR